ncbi:protein phosphatase 2C [Histomonas meleagridis]|uniref:protein phosphatase 2C n=1 Tax=Histomonas meleagridis TaxID=135588 RepID=UPI00355A0C96|nr:protein phosphatase 2C [Histomonas meleagridis]KAH0796811.1 protein phosphatase 2C [Histomonas meleagridis]
MVTKISLRGSSLTSKDADPIAKFIKSSSTIKEIDLSENKFGDAAIKTLLEASRRHPRLEALILEETHITDAVSPEVYNILKAKSCLKILRIAPVKFSSNSLTNITDAIKDNIYISLFTYCDPNTEIPAGISHILRRNNEIMGIIEECITSPWHRTFRKRNDLYKSVKGRRMAEGKAQQLQSLKGNTLFSLYASSEQRAKTAAPKHTVNGSGSIRIGTSETVGLRETMEDFTVVKQDYFGPKTLLVGLFDGHGGREASEYAGNNFPTVLKSHNNEPLSEAFKKSFQEIHQSIQPWCVYCGTTACVSKISLDKVIVANVGDTRCIMVTNKSFERLSFDHKPNLPEEKSYIESHGGNVSSEGRLNGVLAVSRALGDGSIGDAINPIPYVCERDIEESCKFVFASDGLWDVMSDEEAANVVRSEIDPMLAARKLRDTAVQKDSKDNVSVAVVFLTIEESDE